MAEINPIKYNNRIKETRRLRGLTQEELAEALGTSALSINRWELGKSFPQPYYRQKLCDFFELSPEELGLTRESAHATVDQDAVPLDFLTKQELAPPSRRSIGILSTHLKGKRLLTLGRHYRWLWKIIVFLGTTVLLGAVASVIANWFTSSQGMIPADSPLRQLLAVWPITLAVGCSLLLLAVLIWVSSGWHTHEKITLSEQNRLRMLRRLRHTYRDLLMQSLGGAVWIELGLKQKPSVVLTTAHLLLGLPDQSERDLPPGTSILQVYAEAQGELLILGKPGVGKSTLLLSLAQQLVEQAEIDATQLLPIVLPLSSWAIKRQPLQDWCSKQIAEIYNIPLGVCEQWMQHDQILLLLDGLDEMEEAARSACIAAINAYHHEHIMPLVVCSREAEYANASKQERLSLQGAVVIQPLTKEQVDRYLAVVGTPVATLRKALTLNPALQELATTPLMLNVLTLTYQGTSVRNLATKGAALQQQVWDNYVQRMVEHKGNTKPYPLERTRQWLGWLASQLQRQNQTIFYPEHLQPDWLPVEQQRWYNWLAVRLPGILIGVLAGLLIAPLLITFDPGFLLQFSILSGFLGAVFSASRAQPPTHKTGDNPQRKSGSLTTTRLAISALLALVWGGVFTLNMRSGAPFDGWLPQYVSSAISSLIIGLSCMLLMILLPRSVPKQILAMPQNRSWWSNLRRIDIPYGRRALLAAAVLGVGIGLSWGLNYGLSWGLNYGLSWGLSYGLLSILASVILGMLAGDVRLAERLRWTRGSLLRGLFISKHLGRALILICAGLVLFELSQGLGPWLNQGLSQGLSWGLSQGLSWGLSWGLGCWLLLGLFQGVSTEQVEDKQRRLFNQGIRHSLHNSVLISMIAAVVIGVVSVLSWGLSYELSYGLNYGLSWGLSYELSYELGYGLRAGLSQGLSHAWLFAVCGGLLVGVIFSGGLAVLRHYTLRFLLWRAHTFPWQAQLLLEDATARILLRRIGGGYSFTHRLLLDYFADLNTASPSRQPTQASTPSESK